MGKKKLKGVLQLSRIEWVALAAAVVIALILLVAAVGKFFYPVESLRTLDRWTAGFELLFLISLLLFRKHYLVWCFAAVIFAAWGGYALYWCCLELPCSCMGTMVEVPSTFSVVLDFVLLLTSLILGYLLRAGRQKLYLSVLISGLAALAGYAIADCIYSALTG